MRLIQFMRDAGTAVGICEGSDVWALREVRTTYELALRAIAANEPLVSMATHLVTENAISYRALESEGRLLPPVTHPVPASFLVSGTGLTHVGSAVARDTMHKALHADNGEPSDSMKMFQMGIRGGKPRTGELMGVQPEWFYKGTGEQIVAPGGELPLPAFIGSGAEEPEIVGIYLIDATGNPRRLGFALGNDLSDHVTEQKNYLYLAHSKLLPCSIGPELLIGELPDHVVGRSSILRDGLRVWNGDFVSGEANMCHSIANLEQHHFKYSRHRVPGSLHAHFLGCPVMSFNDGFLAQPGDLFEVEVPVFGNPLRNRIVAEPQHVPRPIEAL